MIQICAQPAIDWRIVALSFLAANLAAWLLNAAIDRFDFRGYMALVVVAGVSITLFFAGFSVPLVYIAIAIAYFVATGTPMIIGDAIRSKRRQQIGEKASTEKAFLATGESYDE